MWRGQRDLALALPQLPQLGFTARQPARLNNGAFPRVSRLSPASGGLLVSFQPGEAGSFRQGGLMSLKHFSSTLVAMLLMAPLVVSADPVNINTADAAALAKALNGIGPAK